MSESLNKSSIQLKIISFLTEECDLSTTKLDLKLSLLNSGLLDSFSVFKLVSFLESEFKITLHPDQIHPDDMDTVDKITFLIEKLKKNGR